MNRTSLGRLALLLSLVAATGAVWSAVAHAGAEPHLKSGLVGIARLQTARLGVIYSEPTAVETPTTAPQACMANLAFQHADGTPFMDRAGHLVQRVVKLMPNGAAVLDLKSADVFVDSTDLRSTLRADVRLLPEACLVPGTGDWPPGPCRYPPGPCRNVVVTLDVFDNLTGRTNVILGHSDFIDDPALNAPPEPESPPQ